MKHNLRAWVLLGVLCALPAPVSAQDKSPVAITVRGVTGSVLRAKPRRFLALNVVLENGSREDADGVIRVYRTTKPQSETPDQSLFYERRVSLPGGGRRVVTVYYYCQESEPDNRLCVAYAPDDVPAPPPTFPQLTLDTATVRVLGISSRPLDGPAAAFRNAVVPGPQRAWHVVVEEADRRDLTVLPDHMAGFDSFDAVLVTDLDPDALPPDRAEALIDWVAAGGDLVVVFSGKQGDLAGSPLSRTLPVSVPPGGRATVQRQILAIRELAPVSDPPRSDPVLVDRVSARPGAEILAGDEDGPLVVRGGWGAGRVTYVAFPIDALPLRRWNGREQLGGSLLRIPREPLAPRNEASSAPPLEEILLNLSEALETLTPPSALLVAPLLLLYVALVSPLNFKLLAKRRRLGWTQGVAGGLALVFGLLFYGIGRAYKGSESLATQVALVELASSQQGKSRVDVMTGFFSTGQGLASARAHPEAVVGPIAEQKTSREGRVIQDDNGSHIESLTLDTWALRRFRSLRAEELGHLTGELVLDSGYVKGTLDNQTKHRIQQPLLLFEEGMLDLNVALEPNARLTVQGKQLLPYAGNYDPGEIQLLRALYRDDAGQNYPSVFGHGLGMGIGANPYGGSPPRRILATLRRRLLRSASSPEHVPVLLVGRIDADPQGVLVEGPQTSKLERMLVVCELRSTVEGVIRRLGLQPRVLAANNHYLAVSGSTGSAPILEGGITSEGQVLWGWRVPASRERPFQTSYLEFRWNLDPTPVAQAAVFEGWNFVSRRWAQIVDPGELKYRVNENVWPVQGDNFNSRDFLDPETGLVLIRLRNAGAPTELRRITLDVHGRR